MNKKLPIQCPSCHAGLSVHSLQCDACQTSIIGSFSLPLFLSLDDKDQEFIIEFVLSSGSLKVMAQKLNLSYPTVRNMLDELIEKISNFQNNINE
ncbi:MAG TPA: DUF2089 family protein [Prolixibacteraceae bacterium]|nr:DUF2089 domain-containing protein [Bacteroidales bacterium]HQN93659.1 DUF2089 family protein [Prolixibacteraceae bacterium]